MAVRKEVGSLNTGNNSQQKTAGVLTIESRAALELEAVT